MTDGWVKLTDPKTGQEFYANKLTRQTQWEPPPGFGQSETNPLRSSFSNQSSAAATRSTNGFGSAARGISGHNHSHDNSSQKANDRDLPSNWEQMRDESSGKFFYVDHVNKVTTWEHPGKSMESVEHGRNGYSNNKFSSSTQPTNGHGYNTSVGTDDNYASEQSSGGMATGFGFVPESKVSTNAFPKKSVQKSKPSNSSTWGMSHPPPSANRSTKTPSTASLDYKFASFTNSNIDDDKSTKYYKGTGPSAMDQIDFKVVKVPDRLRPLCPSCGMTFSMSKRRHHCRLCGDIFCDACSSHRVLLPLGGSEYEKPVRVCDGCHVDIDRQNYFSMRRYLTPLLLYDGENAEDLRQAFGSSRSTGRIDDSEHGVGGYIGMDNVAGALTSLSQDLESILLDPSSFSDKMTIPTEVLVPAISRHLNSDETSDRAIRALSSLLSLGNVVGNDSFVMEIYLQDDGKAVFEQIFKLLEWSGESVKILAVQEQASQVLFHLTDHKLFSNILSKEEIEGTSDGSSAVMYCDLHRALRSMLDHTTCGASPSLQRWSAACIRNMIVEDHRRACDAVSDAMTMGVIELSYESFMNELVSTGGAMILSSLVASDDADTRSHAMSALSGTIHTSRELNIRLGVFKEAYQLDNIQVCSEVAIVEAIVSSGACGPSLAQLLLSADNAAATMACDFARTLVQPILTNPLGSSVPRYLRLFGSGNFQDDDMLKVYRQAAIELATNDGVLGALIQLVPEWGSSRPIELRCSAMYTLAAISLTLSGWDSKLKNSSDAVKFSSEGALELQDKVHSAISYLEKERIGELLVEIFSSGSVGSLNTSRDSPSSQLKEAGALNICALSSCSQHFSDYFISSNILTNLIAISADGGYSNASSRGNWAPRCLGSIEAIASILIGGWKASQQDLLQGTKKIQEVTNDSSSKYLEFLLEALDAGIIPLVSQFLSSEQEFNDSEQSYASARVKMAACHIASAIFGLGQCDKTNMGFSRIFEAMGSRHRIIPLIIYLLGSAVPATQTLASQGSSGEKTIHVVQLLEASLVAAANICGADFCSFGSHEAGDGYKMKKILLSEKDVFSCQFEDICTSTCDVVSKGSFLPSALVGAYGEGIVMPTLRLLSTIAENGSAKVIFQQIVRSGVLLPVTDMLRDAMVAGDYYIFDACVKIISKSGPHMTASSENNSVQALRDCVKLLSNVLAIEDRHNASSSEMLTGLKKRCIMAIELLSINSSLWAAIVTYFVPNFSQHWIVENSLCDIDQETRTLLCAGLETINRVISLPAHAVSVANSGIAASLSSVISNAADPKLEKAAIQILHALLSHAYGAGGNGKVEAGLIDIYAQEAACAILSKDSENDFQSTIGNAKLSLEIMQMILSGLAQIHQNQLPQSPIVISFVETALGNPNFVRRLCATLFSHDHDDHGRSLPSIDKFEIESAYGAPVMLFEGNCGAFVRSVDATLYILFWSAFYSSLVHSPNSEVLWDMMMLQDQDMANESSRCLSMLAVSANFLNLLRDEEQGICCPLEKSQRENYHMVALPIVRERLLHILSSGSTGYLQMSRDENALDPYYALLEHYRVPQLCLELMTNAALAEPAFHALNSVLSGFPKVLLNCIVSEKSSLVSLFELMSSPLNLESADKEVAGKIIVFGAAVLSSAGDLGILGDAVGRFGLRSVAVASLSAACLTHEQIGDACLAEDMTEDGSSMSMLCLHGLVDVLSSGNKNENKKIMLSPSEAKAISSSLGKKLSSMVLDRFVHKAELEDDHEVKKFPEVTMLSALASSKEALSFLVANGGLEALSLVAAEGEIAAINALKEVCKFDPTLVLEVDGHISALQVIAKVSPDDNVESSCFELLAAICNKSKTGRFEIGKAEDCQACVDFATENVRSILMTDVDEPDDGAISKEKEEEQRSELVVNEKKDFAKELAAMSFLTSLLHQEECRTMILFNKPLKEAIDSIALEAPTYSLQHSASEFLCTTSRYLKHVDPEAPYNAENITVTLRAILETSHSRSKRMPMGSSSGFTSFGDFREAHHYNENLLVASACRGLESLLSKLPNDSLGEILSELSNLWRITIDFQMTSMKKTASKSNNSGLLMYNISCLFLLCCGKNTLHMPVDVMSNILHLIVSNSTLNEKRMKQAGSDHVLKEDDSNWQAAFTQCLQCIAALTITENYDWEDLISKAESGIAASKPKSRLRRPATMKQNSVANAVSMSSVLEEISSDHSNQLRSAAARRILQNLTY
jgi:hypothetical protein